MLKEIRLLRTNKNMMNKKFTHSLFLIFIINIGGCSFVNQQLADKANETKLLKAGALDANVTGVYDTYQVKFLDKYKITHEWPRNSNGCQYASSPTLGISNGYQGEFYVGKDIFEEGNVTKQRDAHPTWNFDRFVRSKKVTGHCPADSPKCDYGGKVFEKGLTPMCLQTWVRTSHSLTYYFFKRTVTEWEKILPDWGFSKPAIKKIVGTNTWYVYQSELRTPKINQISGPFQMWILPVGTSDYTIALQLNANQNSLNSPEAHLQMQAIYRYLIESVKIENAEQK